MYYTYVLLLSNGDLYKGSTSDIKRRLKEHASGKVASTKKHSTKTVLIECYFSKTDAVRRERFLKTTEGRRLLRMQIRDTLLQLSQAPIV